ncbi:uncharacterized protein LOC128955020 [Oppia nitens]|uniref:uncharacterized protein LOC128955020 n=1 Tax=Oppia nitens TaxID=1686743 RepID=UPI0023DAD156|nr:uncharacterized protein LOC128955020 [Oppia nitens]
MGILCIPLSMVWMTYHNNKYKPSFQTTSSVRLLSPKANNRYHCLRSAALMEVNNNTGANTIGFDMIDLKTQCIQSIGFVFRPRIYDNRTISQGTGVFVVDNRLLLTCYHVVKHNPFVFVQYVQSYDNQGSDSDSKSIIKSQPILKLCPKNVADILYVEPHNDLALVRLRDPPSPAYNTPTTMPITDSPVSTDFGAPVAMIGHGGSVRYVLHPGMVITPQVDNYLIPIEYYISVIPFNEKLPIVAHSTVVLPGNSGGPVIDTNGQVCGICWGGVIRRGQISFAIGSEILMEFMAKALAYESDGIKQTRLRDRYEWDSRAIRQILGIIIDTKPLSDSFTVTAALPTATTDANIIIGRRICLINGQVCNSIDNIRLAIDNRPHVKVTTSWSTTDDDDYSTETHSNDIIKLIDINTITTIDNKSTCIIPLVF